ncbi:hypothetical protein H4CHR_02970 [Variovorax sp. PBS-H4]|uniref:hypothetical protein n=1 Tax=Variovorax sp. PBS-H4 TaxID=434008 RepID=UPI00131651EE|nr:hypothetical protein [Variovorax sp. PBS-H4]VTU32231.1 hypothetical protein H4CHR_02970 [Variovorax sp. PBS-H4]
MLFGLNKIVSGVRGVFKGAAGQLPPIVEPKVPTKPQSQQSFSKRSKTSNGDQRLSATDRRTANLDLLTLRNGTSTKSTIRDLAKVSPDLSASVWAYQRMVVTRNFTAVARNQDGTPNPEATAAVQQIIARFNYLTDYTDGFSGVSSIHAVAESLTKELRIEGACSLELVLDKARLPNRLVPVSTSQIDFFEDNTGYTYPVQKASSGDISLDIPTFFYEALDQDLLTAYSDSPMEAAIQSVLADTEFTNDIRRTTKRALHPRLKAVIDYEKFRNSMPPEVSGDAEAMKAFTLAYIEDVANTVNGLEPDDALISFDSVDFEYLNNGNVTLNKEWEVLQEMNNAKMATGAKAPPAVLGHGSGSQNVASTESALFARYCEGVQNKVNSILSRALTLGVRLLGHDVYVVFGFDRVDLRPDSELEAFRAMRQSRILMQLSLGLISDEEAGIAITGQLPPAGAPKLSGTFFMAGAQDPNAVDTASAQSNTGALQQGTSSDAPKNNKGKQPDTSSTKEPAVKRVK